LRCGPTRKPSWSGFGDWGQAVVVTARLKWRDCRRCVLGIGEARIDLAIEPTISAGAFFGTPTPNDALVS